MNKITLVVFAVAASLALAPVLVNAQNFWQQTNGPYGGTVKALAISPNGDIFAGTEGGGVFHSIDNGDHWIATNTGLTNLAVSFLALNSSGYVFAGTSGSGLFRSAQPITGVKEDATAMPISFLLEQNYPNPFSQIPRFAGNPTTTIAFALPKASFVTLKI